MLPIDWSKWLETAPDLVSRSQSLPWMADSGQSCLNRRWGFDGIVESQCVEKHFRGYICGLHVGLILYCLVFRWCLESCPILYHGFYIIHIFGMFMDKVELISNEALTHRITDPSWWFGFGTCGNAGTVVFSRFHNAKIPMGFMVILQSAMFWCCFFVVLQNQGGSL